MWSTASLDLLPPPFCLFLSIYIPPLPFPQKQKFLEHTHTHAQHTHKTHVQSRNTSQCVLTLLHVRNILNGIDLIRPLVRLPLPPLHSMPLPPLSSHNQLRKRTRVVWWGGQSVSKLSRNGYTKWADNLPKLDPLGQTEAAPETGECVGRRLQIRIPIPDLQLLESKVEKTLKRFYFKTIITK